MQSAFPFPASPIGSSDRRALRRSGSSDARQLGREKWSFWGGLSTTCHREGQTVPRIGTDEAQHGTGVHHRYRTLYHPKQILPHRPPQNTPRPTPVQLPGLENTPTPTGLWNPTPAGLVALAMVGKNR